jgi:hypothetical protein
MTRAIGFVLMMAAAGTILLEAQAKRYPLESADGLSLHNVTATPATLQGKKGVKVTFSEEAMKQLANLPQDQRAHFMRMAVIDGVEFANGVIEADIAGEPAPGAGEGARGFVGIAFRVAPDLKKYDAFYLRPTNGRADDQERRNHATQYISEPDWTWFRLRQETPSKYEAYADMLPGTWTHVKIEVRGDKARLYVNGSEQPTLIVNDVKTGATAKGGVALWIEPGTIAHFRNLTIDPAS